jgi:hypothetical protein
VSKQASGEVQTTNRLRSLSSTSARRDIPEVHACGTDALTIQAGIATSERDDREMARRLAESFEKDDRAFADQGRADHHYNEKAHANGSRAEDFPASGSFRSTSVSPRRMTVPFFPPSMYEGMDMDQFSLFFLVVSLLTVFRKRERTGKAE